MASGNIPNPSAQGTAQLSGVTVTSTDTRFKSASSITAYKTGNVVQFSFSSRWDFSGTTLDEGQEVELKVTGIPYPLAIARSVAFQSTRIYVAWIDTDGAISFRALKGSNNNDNAPLAATFVYIIS